jgi:hypothetical protein
VLQISISQSQRILLQLNSTICPIQLNDGCLKEWIELVGKRKRLNGKRQIAVPARILISGSGRRWLLLAASGVILVAFITVVFSASRFDSKAGPATLPQSVQFVASSTTLMRSSRTNPIHSHLSRTEYQDDE